MPVARLLRNVKQKYELVLVVCCKSLLKSDSTFESLTHVFQDFASLTGELLDHKSTPAALRKHTLPVLGPWKKRM